MKTIFEKLFRKSENVETTVKSRPIISTLSISNPSEGMDNLIKMKEAMRLIKASAPTVRKYARLGYYKEYRFGEKLVFYNREEMLNFILSGSSDSDARHIGTSEYYRELINQTKTVKRELSNLKEEQTEAQFELNKVKADVSKEKLKNSAADVGSKLMDGVSSLLGTPKMAKIEMENKNLHAKIELLHKENQTIRQRVETVKQNAATEITNQKQQFYNRKKELIKESNDHKSTLQKIYDLFPHIKELLIFEKFCQQVGFGTEMIRRMFNREAVGFNGEIYSHEYERKFHTDHSVAKFESDPNCKGKFQLNIDGRDIYDWFRQKQKEFLQYIGVNIKELKNNRGMKL